MKRLAKLFIFILICLTANISLFAQIFEPVKWELTTKRINDTIAELIFKASVEKGWHIYSQAVPPDGPMPTKFTFTKNKDYQLVGKVIEPKPKEENDPVFEMVVKYFENTVVFKQKVKILSNKPVIIKGEYEFQACDEKQCTFPPPTSFEFKLDGAKTVSNTPIITNDVKDSANSIAKDTSKPVKKDTASINKTSLNSINTPGKDDSLWGFFWLAFLSGLVAILTPCVFPMIPMTVSFFMHNEKSKVKAKLQAGIYGLSIIVIYTLVGTLLSVFLGPDFANWLSTHWLPNIFFFLIFMIFAASFFGMFEITLPSWMVNKTDKQADKGGFMGAFFMAFTLVLVSFSCTGPIVGAILVLSAGGEILKPIIGMLGFGLSFALPFTVFALFPSWLNKLPKSGGWLNVVKVVLGFLELALGLKFLSIPDQTYHWGILDIEVFLAIWIVIFTLLGFYLLGKLKFSHDSDVKHVGVPRLLLAIISFSFAVYMVPGLFGAPLKALAGYLPPQHTHDFDLNKIIREDVINFSGSGGNSKTSTSLCETPKYSDKLELPHGLKGYFDYDEALKCAKEQNKPLFIDFTGHACANCRKMEQNVWSNPEVLKRLTNNFIVVSLYVDERTIVLPVSEQYISKSGKLITGLGDKNADIQATRYDRNSQPYYILLDTNEKMLNEPRAYDPDVDAYIKFLDEGYNEFQKRTKK